MVRSFKYLGTAVIRVNITDDETKELKAQLRLPIKPITLCTLHSHINKSSAITK